MMDHESSPDFLARRAAVLMLFTHTVRTAKRFVPTAANYFCHVNRASIETAVREAKGDEAALQVKAAAKKTEAAIIAECLVADAGWLPGPLRFAEPAPIDEDDFEDSGHDDETDQLVDEFPEAAD
ncbi:hypothetical protein H8A97_01725 [Bradyrhizobium sp. Arg62]|uniref:hypothetical protein n=1 Tax=Bradyrhizobium brasilense TaxID=1419277 RepID=UPI001E5845A9|nr:hypothetical protein [Bradyrhizobium brasilense]MCC8943854.1 hypothetical protein [Bradyrhizobium brasilense]